MGAKLLQDIYLQYLVTFRPSQLQFGIDTAQSSPSAPLHYLFFEVCLQEPKRPDLLIKPFPHNHSINNVYAGLNNTRKRDVVKVKAKTSVFIEIYPEGHQNWKNLKIVDFYEIFLPTQH